MGVGDIEAAVGLAPRRGALYKHFASKEGLLEAAVRRYVDGEEQARQEFDSSSTDDLTEQALPELVEEFRNRVSERGYTIVAAILRSWLGQATSNQDAPNIDVDATAVLLTGALVNARRSMWTFGHPPGEVDDERLVAAWARLCLAALDPVCSSPSSTTKPS